MLGLVVTWSLELELESGHRTWTAVEVQIRSIAAGYVGRLCLASCNLLGVS